MPDCDPQLRVSPKDKGHGFFFKPHQTMVAGTPALVSFPQVLDQGKARGVDKSAHLWGVLSPSDWFRWPQVPTWCPA